MYYAPLLFCLPTLLLFTSVLLLFTLVMLLLCNLKQELNDLIEERTAAVYLSVANF